MPGLAQSDMSVDEFLVWSEGRDGAWELIDGAPVAMSPERLEHLEIKGAAFIALREGIRRAKAPCQALPDGATVRISQKTSYRPDALVRCGPKLPPGALEIPDPVIVVEVVSPTSAALDHGDKVDGYFSLASVQHYLIVVPEKRRVVHCRRGQAAVIERRLFSAGPIDLDPRGLRVETDALFGKA